MRAKKKATVHRHGQRRARPHPARRSIAVGGTPIHRWSPVFAATRQLVTATLDLAEAAVVDVPEERAKVRNVRALAESRFAGIEPPKVDPLDIAFTIGLVVTLAESDFSKPGISSLLLELLPLTDPMTMGSDRRASAAPRSARGRSEPEVVCRLYLDDFQF